MSACSGRFRACPADISAGLPPREGSIVHPVVPSNPWTNVPALKLTSVRIFPGLLSSTTSGTASSDPNEIRPAIRSVRAAASFPAPPSASTPFREISPTPSALAGSADSARPRASASASPDECPGPG